MHLPAWRDIVVQGLFQGVLLGVASIFVYTRAVASLGAQETALCTAALPCITTLLAVYLLREWPSLSALLGVFAVTVGVAVAAPLKPSGDIGSQAPNDCIRAP